jgi:hypothetical protein
MLNGSPTSSPDREPIRATTSEPSGTSPGPSDSSRCTAWLDRGVHRIVNGSPAPVPSRSTHQTVCRIGSNTAGSHVAGRRITHSRRGSGWSSRLRWPRTRSSRDAQTSTTGISAQGGSMIGPTDAWVRSTPESRPDAESWASVSRTDRPAVVAGERSPVHGPAWVQRARGSKVHTESGRASVQETKRRSSIHQNRQVSPW